MVPIRWDLFSKFAGILKILANSTCILRRNREKGRVYCWRTSSASDKNIGWSIAEDSLHFQFWFHLFSFFNCRRLAFPQKQIIFGKCFELVLASFSTRNKQATFHSVIVFACECCGNNVVNVFAYNGVWTRNHSLVVSSFFNYATMSPDLLII